MNDAKQRANAENEIVNKTIRFDNAEKFDLKYYDGETWTHRANSKSNGVKIWIQYMSFEGEDSYQLTIYYKNAPKDVQGACEDFIKQYGLKDREWQSIVRLLAFLNEHKDEIEELLGGAVKKNTISASKNAKIAKELIKIARNLVAMN